MMSTDFKQILMFPGARKLVDVCAAVQQGEKVLIVTDVERISVAKSIASACVARGAEVVVMIMTPRKVHGIEPPAPIVAAMSAADVVFEPTSKSIAHTAATQGAREKGARVITLAEITEEMLISGAIEADFEAQKQTTERVMEALSQASKARVYSDAGTEIEMSLEGRRGRALTGLACERGSYSSPPNIEASIAPVEGTANGVVIVDASISGIGLISNPVRIKVQEGVARAIEGGEEARKLRQMLKSANNPYAYYIAELGIGLNPKASLKGSLLEDEAVLGTVHIALGSNADFGGTIRAGLHVDSIIWKPTLELDGKVILEEGELRI